MTSLLRAGRAGVAPEDLFPRTRSDAELRFLVFKLAQHTREPFRELVARLTGDELSEAQARQRWGAFVTHRRALAGALGRPVHLRVAALDLLALEGQEHARPLAISAAALSQLWAAATTDGLTGLANARHFRSLLGHELAQRDREALTVSFLDLDGFKAVNDTNGHAEGDRALVEVADALKRIARRGDVVARLGGDEFAMLFIGATVANARALTARVTGRLRPLLERTGMGLSFGFAQADGTDTAETLLTRADEAMYRVKRSRKSSATVERPLAVYASTRPEAYWALQKIFADAGVLLAPAPAPAALEALVSLLKPAAVLANVLFPPKGGGAVLDAMGSGPELALVVPRTGWRATAGMRRTVVAPDANDGVLTALFARLTRDQLEPLPRLASAEQASEVMKVVGALSRGHQVAPARLELLASVAEVDLLQRALGS